jgi:uncharacterized phage protein (TIGR02220 family)
MITIIDHTIRARLNLHPSCYMIAQACAQFQPLMKGTGVNTLSDLLGYDASTVSKCMKQLIEVGLIEKKENGYYYPTNKWYLAHDGEEVDVVTVNEELANQVIMLFNEVNWSKYQIPSNAGLVKKLLKQNNKLTLDHFRSVIMHKKITWGEDEKMKEYNRPSTIFSGKFLKYLDDANHYWLNKHKHDSATSILGN